MGELRVEFPAEFTRPAGAGVEAIDDGWVDVFHEEKAPEKARTIRPVVRLGHILSLVWCSAWLDAVFVLQEMTPDKPPVAAAIFAAPEELERKNAEFLR
jgi:hypothetical protein